MNKFTPGPWKYAANSADTPEIRCIGVTGGNMIGDVAYLQSYTTDDYDDREEVLANASLIAAAPDLLGILERIRDDRSWRSNDNALWQDILAVISKATGQ